MTTGGLLLRRLLHGAATIFVAASLGFLVLHYVPGDGLARSSEAAVGDVRSGNEARLATRARLGLDLPLPVQYARYVSRALHGDLGVSISERRSVASALLPAVGNSLLLCGTGLLLAVALGGFVGILQGWRPDSSVGRGMGALLTTLYALPEFVLAVLLIGVLAYRSRLFPVGGIMDPVLGIVGSSADQLRDRLWHLVLPAMTLALGWGAAVARQQRVGLVENRAADFVRTARAKGVSELTLLCRHALPPSLPATVATIGTMLPVVVSGAVVVESLYAWPGMGSLMLHAVGSRDYPLLAGAILVVGCMVSVSSLLVDVAARALDPRQRSFAG